MNTTTIQCKNNELGYIILHTGDYRVPDVLVNTIKLMLSVRDISIPEHEDVSKKLWYDLESIVFVPTHEDPKRMGDAFPEQKKVVIYVGNIASLIAGVWEDQTLIYDSYGVHATNWLMMTILHEALHCHYHRQYAPMGAETKDDSLKNEEEVVRKKTDDLYLAFVKKYGLEFETTLFMYNIVTDRLARMNTERAHKVLSTQLWWIKNGVVSMDRHGGIVLSIREDMRMRLMPHTSWRLPKSSLREGLLEEFKDPTVGMEHLTYAGDKGEAAVVVPEPMRKVPPPPPIPQAQAVVVPPPPPVKRTPPPPPPPPKVTVPITMPEMRMQDLVPIEIYERDEGPELEKAARMFAAMAGEDTVADIAPAKTAVVGPPPSQQYLPSVGDENLEKIIQRIGKHLYDYIFIECGWDNASATGFTNPEAVMKKVGVHDPGEVVVEYYTTDAMGRHTPRKFGGYVEGKVTGVNKIPSFELLFNIGGKLSRRLFLPQNINKKKPNGEPSYYSMRARKYDTRVMWVIDQDVTDPSVKQARGNGQRATKFVGKFENGQYTAITN